MVMNLLDGLAESLKILATSSLNSFAFARESIRSFVECLAFLQWSARTLITLIGIALASAPGVSAREGGVPPCTLHGYLESPSQEESQRDSVIKPRVARNELQSFPRLSQG